MTGEASLADWTFRVTEVSVGVYRASGRNRKENSVERDGLDPDQLLEACKLDAKKMQTQLNTLK